jgi:hypothetical protein
LYELFLKQAKSQLKKKSGKNIKLVKNVKRNFKKLPSKMGLCGQKIIYDLDLDLRSFF